MFSHFYGQNDTILLIQELHICPKNPSYRALCEFIMSHLSLKSFQLY